MYSFSPFSSIINVRETRVTGIISHILICMSIFLVPYPIAYIPTAVLDGLFLYMAATSLDGLQMFERITLLFMEQVSDLTQGDINPFSLIVFISPAISSHVFNNTN